jgi:hypothetical protein
MAPQPNFDRSDDGSRVAHITDELLQRAFYRQWRRLMCTAASSVPRLRSLTAALD